jgi:hypothetical protein
MESSEGAKLGDRQLRETKRLLLLGFLRDFENLLAAVKPVGRDVMTPMRHSGGGIHR